MDGNTWRTYVKKIQLAYIAHGYPITYQQAMIIAREYYEKGLELEKQKTVPVKEESIPNLKTVNKKKKEPAEPDDNVEVVKKKKAAPRKKKVIEVSDSESDSEDEEYRQYLKLKRKYNKNKKNKDEL